MGGGISFMCLTLSCDVFMFMLFISTTMIPFPVVSTERTHSQDEYDKRYKKCKTRYCHGMLDL